MPLPAVQSSSTQSPDPTSPDPAAAQQQQQNEELKKSISDAYAAVQGAAGVQTFAAYTLEDAANDQVQQISGPSTPTRPNELDSVQAILKNVTQAAAKIKSLPADAFVEPDPTNDVNPPT